MTNGLTTVAGIPSGGGQASKPAPERSEAKKPAPAPAAQPQENWYDIYDIAGSMPTPLDMDSPQNYGIVLQVDESHIDALPTFWQAPNLCDSCETASHCLKNGCIPAERS